MAAGHRLSQPVAAPWRGYGSGPPGPRPGPVAGRAVQSFAVTVTNCQARARAAGCQSVRVPRPTGMPTRTCSPTVSDWHWRPARLAAARCVTVGRLRVRVGLAGTAAADSDRPGRRGAEPLNPGRAGPGTRATQAQPGPGPAESA